MPRATREIWTKRVERWKDSGLSAPQFAAELGVNPRTLMFWKWQLDREARGAVSPKRASGPKRRSTRVNFVEVAAPTVAPTQETRIEIAIGDRAVIRVPIGFDEATLEGVMRVIERAR